MKKIVNENQRALLFKNGRYVKLLYPGSHRFLGKGYRAQLMELTGEFMPEIGRVEQYVTRPGLMEHLCAVEVGDSEVALRYANGRYDGLLLRGLHAFWRAGAEYTFDVREVGDPEITDIPRAVLSKLRPVVQEFEVPPGEKGLLYYDGVFVKLLDEGVHWFWGHGVSGVKVTVTPVDARLRQLSIQGQEILTLDKVAVRVNFVCRYRIIDCVRIMTEIGDYEEQMHVAAQLILREYVGQNRLDELLENKERLGNLVFESLKRREAEFFIELYDAGVRDIILPGEIRAIMNTVLVAEKKAQANVIARREEVASTRSLLNTAKLMEENQTLYRLKEMEYIEKICENVGGITVNGGGDLLTQLAGLLKG